MRPRQEALQGLETLLVRGFPLMPRVHVPQRVDREHPQRDILRRRRLPDVEGGRRRLVSAVALHVPFVPLIAQEMPNRLVQPGAEAIAGQAWLELRDAISTKQLGKELLLELFRTQIWRMTAPPDLGGDVGLIPTDQFTQGGSRADSYALGVLNDRPGAVPRVRFSCHPCL